MKQALYQYLGGYKADLAVISTDKNGLVTVFNHSAETLLGYTANEIVGKKIPLVNFPELICSPSPDLIQARKGEFRSQKGESIQADIISNPILNEKGQINGYLFTASREPLNRIGFSLKELPDREILAVMLDIEIKRAERQKQDLSFLQIRLDHFNHTMGQLRPEQITHVEQIAYHLNNRIQRASDLLARAFGAEFYIILPATDRAGAVTLAEQCRLLISSLAITHPENPEQLITASIGIFHGKPNRQIDIKYILNATQKAVNEATLSGGNCSKLVQTD